MRDLFFLRFFFLSSERQQSSNELVRNHDCSPIGSVRLPIDPKPIATRRDQSYYCRQMFDMDTIYPSIGSICVCVCVSVSTWRWEFGVVAFSSSRVEGNRRTGLSVRHFWNSRESCYPFERKLGRRAIYCIQVIPRCTHEKGDWHGDNGAQKKQTWCLKVVRLLLSISHEQGHVCVCGLDKNRIISFGSRQKLAHARRNHLT